MPGHFIARVGGKRGTLVDPFSGGSPLTIKQCARIVGSLSNSTLPWQDEYLDPVCCGAIAERVLRNLMNAYRRLGDQLGLYRVAVFHAALRPDDPEARLLHACMAEEIGAFRLAARLYRDITRRFEGRREAIAAGRRLGKVKARVCGLH